MDDNARQQSISRMSMRDEDRLAELGYKQELTRNWSLLHNFGVSFSIIVRLQLLSSGPECGKYKRHWSTVYCVLPALHLARRRYCADNDTGIVLTSWSMLYQALGETGVILEADMDS